MKEDGAGHSLYPFDFSQGPTNAKSVYSTILYALLNGFLSPQANFFPDAVVKPDRCEYCDAPVSCGTRGGIAYVRFEP